MAEESSISDSPLKGAGSPKRKRRALNRLTDRDILDSNPEKPRRLTDGGGLSVSIDPDGNKYFQFRYSLHGKGQTTSLGKYSEMTLEQARESAALLRKKVEKVRKKRAISSFDSTLKQAISEKDFADFYCFHSMQDAGEFIRNLNDARNNGAIDKEVYYAIYLLLLVPSKLDELLSTMRSDLNRGNGRWEIKHLKTPTAGKTQSRAVALLSKKALKVVSEIPVGKENILGSSFPQFAQQSKAQRKNLLNCELKKIWPHYPIKIEDFRVFFKTMAIRNSFFKQELIDDAMKHSDRKGEVENSSYALQRTALADWWAQELENSENIF